MFVNTAHLYIAPMSDVQLSSLKKTFHIKLKPQYLYDLRERTNSSVMSKLCPNNRNCPFVEASVAFVNNNDEILFGVFMNTNSKGAMILNTYPLYYDNNVDTPSQLDDFIHQYSPIGFPPKFWNLKREYPGIRACLRVHKKGWSLGYISPCPSIT